MPTQRHLASTYHDLVTIRHTQWHWTSPDQIMPSSPLILHNDIGHHQIISCFHHLSFYTMTLHIKRSCYRHLSTYIIILHISRSANATSLPTHWHWTSADYVMPLFCPQNETQHQQIVFRHLSTYTLTLHVSRSFNATSVPTQWHLRSAYRAIVLHNGCAYHQNN